MDRDIFGPPRLRIGGRDEERHATWLETFFDLVFVVAVSQVAHRLMLRLSIAAVLEYLVLFVPIWWAWTGVVFADPNSALPTAQRWLIAGSAAVCFASLGFVHFAKALAGTARCSVPSARVRWGGAVAALGIATLGSSLHPIDVLGLLALVGVVEVAWEMRAG